MVLPPQHRYFAFAQRQYAEEWVVARPGRHVLPPTAQQLIMLRELVANVRPRTNAPVAQARLDC